MTAPVGYPDFIRSVSTSRELLVMDVAQSIAVARVLGPFATVNMHSVGIKFQGVTNHAQLTLDWFLDAAETDLLATDRIDIREIVLFNQTITVKGPFLRVTITPQGGPPSVYNLTMWEMPYESVTNDRVADMLLLHNNGAAVGATATITILAQRAFMGPASITMYSPDATQWDATLQHIAADGTISSLLRADPNHPVVAAQFYIQGAPVQVQLHNADAVGRTFQVYLTGKPLYP